MKTSVNNNMYVVSLGTGHLGIARETNIIKAVDKTFWTDVCWATWFNSRMEICCNVERKKINKRYPSSQPNSPSLKELTASFSS